MRFNSCRAHNLRNWATDGSANADTASPAQRELAQQRARSLVRALVGPPASRRAAVVLAKQRVLDPCYPSDQTLADIAALLVSQWWADDEGLRL